ncbi:relaxase/mobilization nuclease domain-containing protein [Vagococcus fluvialis]|uniref:Relaxase n=1 Tax=Vagococcus fluvialis bH819 TaxID=1255619 RepID=A0A1X6WRX0_9ENTE|nr:relaxase/mobilization nuclease domain-containing protein [Vagococcus fluvialis]SLM87017.1 relaxase [Vagococcus fluvialis bH819]
MVYTKHFPIHSFKNLKRAEKYISNADKTLVDYNEEPSRLDDLFRYIANNDKTMMKQLVSTYGVVDSETAYEEFKYTKMKAAYMTGRNYKFNSVTKKLEPPSLIDIEKKNTVLARHLIQSFSPEDNLTPEQVHEIGRKTILEFTGGEYEFVIATHTDKEHIHNHIILNTTNLETGKALPWKIAKTKGGHKDISKFNFEKISDKVASEYGARLIEKSPKNSHQKYTKWETESIYKLKIKSRLDYLIEHSSSIDDFMLKAEALNLSVNFSGKWATYRLLDEPQIKNTRGRNIVKGDPTRYNKESIEEKLKENSGIFSIEDVVENYHEKTSRVEQDFDYQITVEDWQVSHSTEKGYYLNVDVGYNEPGKLFIGSYKVDRLEDGQLNLFIKEKDFFYLMNDKHSEFNRYITGASLVRQLQRYNGQVPLKKEPVMTQLKELVYAINFLAEHDVQDGRQLRNLENQFDQALTEANETLEKLSEKMMMLHQISKLLIESEVTQQPQEVQRKLSSLLPHATLNELSYDDIKSEIASIQKSQTYLKETVKTTVKKIENVHLIQAMPNKNHEIKQERKV